MKHLAGVVGAALGLSTLGLAGATLAAPPCRVSVALEPEMAWVDEQVLYRLRIESREDVRNVEWLIPPAFPGLRWERLPGHPDAGRTTRDGVDYHVREEHRALFPERPGEFVLPAASLRCAAAAETSDTDVPEVRLRARALPAEGRPEGFSGLVGALSIERRLHPLDASTAARAAPSSGDPPQTALRVSTGQTLRLSVQLRGNGNLWDAAPPLVPGASLGAGAEVFPLPPKQDLERGQELSTRRLFRYDIVPRKPGRLTLPELRLDYFDPASESYAVAVAPEIALEVDARAAPIDVVAGPGPEHAAMQSRTGGRGSTPWRGFAAALVVTALAWGVWRRRRAGGRRPSAPDEAPPLGDPREREAAQLARRLRGALAPHVESARSATPEEILERTEHSPALREAARVLAAVELARFDPQARAPDRDEIERALAGLGGSSLRRSDR